MLSAWAGRPLVMVEETDITAVVVRLCITQAVEGVGRARLVTSKQGNSLTFSLPKKDGQIPIQRTPIEPLLDPKWPRVRCIGATLQAIP